MPIVRFGYHFQGRKGNGERAVAPLFKLKTKIMNQPIVFQYQNSPISFDFGNGQKMINATEMARHFGKQPRDFLKSKPTKDFINILSSKTGVLLGNVTKVVNGGNNNGTWMHQKLALKFAAWLNPRFELWVYDRIEELLTTGKVELTSTPPKSDEELMLLGLQAAQRKVKALKAENAILKPKAEYTDQVLKTRNAFITGIIAQSLGMTTQALNRKLKELGVQYKRSKVWHLTTRYVNKEYAKIATRLINKGTEKERTVHQLVWNEKGRNFISNIINQSIESA